MLCSRRVLFYLPRFVVLYILGSQQDTSGCDAAPSPRAGARCMYAWHRGATFGPERFGPETLALAVGPPRAMVRRAGAPRGWCTNERFDGRPPGLGEVYDRVYAYPIPRRADPKNHPQPPAMCLKFRHGVRLGLQGPCLGSPLVGLMYMYTGVRYNAQLRMW